MSDSKPKECYYYDIKRGLATEEEVRLWRNFTRRIPKHLQKKRGLKRKIFFDLKLVEEWARLGYNRQEIADDLGIGIKSLDEHNDGAYARGKAAYEADCIAAVDMKLVERLYRKRHSVDDIMTKLGIEFSNTKFREIAKDALAWGKASRPAMIEVVEQVPVHQPRFVPYNGKPCAPMGHKARRIINMGGACAECHRLNNTKSKKLQDYIGQPRKRGATYKSSECPACHTSERYESTDRCVNCTRHYAFNYSRKIGLGTFVAKRKTK